MATNLFKCNYCATGEVPDMQSEPPECVTCYENGCYECINDEGNCVPCK